MKMKREASYATALGASLLHRTDSLALGAALQLAVTQQAVGSGQCHRLTLANTWSWSYLQGREFTGLHVTPRATFLTAHHWPQPHAPGKPARASAWQVQGASVLLGGQGNCTQPQPPLLSVPEPPARSQLISSTTQSHFMVLGHCRVLYSLSDLAQQYVSTGRPTGGNNPCLK